MDGGYIVLFLLFLFMIDPSPGQGDDKSLSFGDMYTLLALWERDCEKCAEPWLLFVLFVYQALCVLRSVHF